MAGALTEAALRRAIKADVTDGPLDVVVKTNADALRLRRMIEPSNDRQTAAVVTGGPVGQTGPIDGMLEGRRVFVVVDAGAANPWQLAAHVVVDHS